VSAISPRIRRRARERAVQFLFGLDFTRDDWGPALDRFWEGNPSRPGVKRYGTKLIQGVMGHIEALDDAIADAVSNWSPDRVGYVERNVLRVALYEMRFAADVPRNVAINEAIEIAKRYGGDDSPRFVNGVLDRLKEAEPRDRDS